MPIETGKRDKSLITCILEAYGCLWHFRFQHILISLFAFLPFCLAGYLGYLEPVLTGPDSREGIPEGFQFSFFLLIATTFIWLVPSAILWHRLFLLGPEHFMRRKFWPLISRSFHFSIKILVFLGVILVLMFLLSSAVLMILNQINLDQQGSVETVGSLELTVYLSAAAIISLLGLAIGLRLSLAFAAQSIGKTLSFRSSWDLTRTLTGHMLFSLLIGVIPSLGIVTAVQFIVLRLTGLDLFAGWAGGREEQFLMIFALSPLMSLPLAFACAQTSVFYRNCGACDFQEPS
ncbi:hypothetical protein [Emcibacter sp.]|uniref:hypothetical protein n=1 Tax=Emcibacter sp. TaxID=1979954 RepID=UPI003A914CFE